MIKKIIKILSPYKNSKYIPFSTRNIENVRNILNTLKFALNNNNEDYSKIKILRIGVKINQANDLKDSFLYDVCLLAFL